MTRRLDNKVIAMTGGASGIGAATARRMAAEGAHVVIGDINLAGAEDVAGAIVADGGSAKAILCDIAVEAQVKALVDFTVDSFGGLDGYFSNAANLSKEVLGRDTDAVDTPPEVWQGTLDVNLIGTYFGHRHAIPHLIARGGGAIVNTLSVAAFIGEPVRMAFAASKAAIAALSRNSASRFGKQGVRSNCVAPGAVLSDTMQASVSREYIDEILGNILSPRLGRPEDIAATVCFLLSDDAEWISGQTFRVDGGWTLT